MSAFVGFYLVILALLMSYGAHRIWLVRGATRARGRTHGPGPAPATLAASRVDPIPELVAHAARAAPTVERETRRVLVQLPIYNEGEVAERLIESAARLDHPADRLWIQVLDDSDDGTAARSARAVQAWRARGVPIEHLQRAQRSGFKAGALAAGLAAACAPSDEAPEVVAIFDADFEIPRDFLVRALPAFTEPGVGMVQARWAFRNEQRNLLTRVQALLLDGHFGVEHRARAAAGRFFNFNGTAGVWRVAAIHDAGGWRADTITEDLDLSIRAWLRGWRFVYLDDLRVPSVLPETMRAFKIQQDRWVSGSLQTARLHLGRVLSSRLPIAQKLDLCLGLTGNLTYVLLLFLALTVPLAVFLRLDGSASLLLWSDVPFFLLATGSVALFYGAARGARSWASFLGVLLPALMGLGLGLSLHNARAVARGLAGGPRRFERTPKGPMERRAGAGRVDRLTWCEPLLAAYVGGAAAVAAAAGSPFSLPFLGLFVVGFLGVFASGHRRPV